MKISRNDPCPCGSGKKYKKCCVDKDATFDDDIPPAKKMHLISGAITTSSDMPVFSEGFFKGKKTGLSAYSLINSLILNPEIEFLATELSKIHTVRGGDEAEKIKKCSSIAGLVSLLKEGIDNINQLLLQNILLEKPEESVVALMQELRNSVSDIFVEVSVKTIALAKINVADDLMCIITKHDKSIYPLSLLCLLLGYQKHSSIPQFLWNYYRFFQSQYPDQNYWQGPFYGLWENWASATFDNK